MKHITHASKTTEGEALMRFEVLEKRFCYDCLNPDLLKCLGDEILFASGI